MKLEYLCKTSFCRVVVSVFDNVHHQCVVYTIPHIRVGRSYKPKVYIVLWKKEVIKVVAFMQGLFRISFC